jgi:phage terminase small subunit
MSDNLTPKQELFAQKYVELSVASDAYRLAYNAQDMSPEAIHVEASRLLQNPKVAPRVEELESLRLKRHQVTVDRVVAEYSKLAFLDIRKAFDEEGRLKPIQELDDDTAAAISGLEVEALFEGKGAEREIVGRLHKIKLSDKKGALDSLSKYLGIATDKVTVTMVNQPLPDQDREMLKEYAAEEAE